jgi:hypothetical protein
MAIMVDGTMEVDGIETVDGIVAGIGDIIVVM